MNWPQPHSPSHCTGVWEEVENSGIKWSLGRREGWGQRFGFISHYPIWIWQVIHLFFFLQAESVLPIMVIYEWSLPALVLTQKPFTLFSSLLPSWGGEWWSSFGEHLASRQGQPSTAAEEKELWAKREQSSYSSFSVQHMQLTQGRKYQSFALQTPEKWDSGVWSMQWGCGKWFLMKSWKVTGHRAQRNFMSLFGL